MLIPEPSNQESWREDPLYEWDEYIITLPQVFTVSSDEIEQWLVEPVLPRDTKPEALQLYI